MQTVVVTAAPGTSAVLRCQLVAGASPPTAAVSWRLPDGGCVRASGPADSTKPVLFRMGASQECAPSRSLADRCVARLHADGSSTLEVAHCGPLDTGLYVCCLHTDGASDSAVSARLVVTGGSPKFERRCRDV